MEEMGEPIQNKPINLPRVYSFENFKSDGTKETKKAENWVIRSAKKSLPKKQLHILAEFLRRILSSPVHGAWKNSQTMQWDSDRSPSIILTHLMKINNAKFEYSRIKHLLKMINGKSEKRQ